MRATNFSRPRTRNEHDNLREAARGAILEVQKKQNSLTTPELCPKAKNDTASFYVNFRGRYLEMPHRSNMSILIA
jgi:hypothetical protein